MDISPKSKQFAAAKHSVINKTKKEEKITINKTETEIIELREIFAFNT